MRDRSKRQTFLGPDSDKVLAQLHVGIVGLGGGGSHIAQQLAHVGIGHYTLVDDDRVEESNLNRLIGATYADALRKERKVDVAARLITGVLPTAIIRKIPKKWQAEAEPLRDCDILVGCLDTYDDRLQVEALARRYLIPYVDLGMDVEERGDRYGIYGQVTLSMPGMPCLECLNVIREEWRSREAAEYGATGGRPQVVWPNGVLASLAVGTIIQLVTPWHDQPAAAVLLEYDGNAHAVEQSSMLASLEGCPHFESVDNIGDPWFTVQAEGGTRTRPVGLWVRLKTWMGIGTNNS